MKHHTSQRKQNHIPITFNLLCWFINFPVQAPTIKMKMKMKVCTTASELPAELHDWITSRLETATPCWTSGGWSWFCFGPEKTSSCSTISSSQVCCHWRCWAMFEPLMRSLFSHDETLNSFIIQYDHEGSWQKTFTSSCSCGCRCLPCVSWPVLSVWRGVEGLYPEGVTQQLKYSK